MVTMMHWGDRHLSHGRPPVVIRHKDCGGAVGDRGICERCGELLDARDAYTEAGPGSAVGRPRSVAA